MYSRFRTNNITFHAFNYSRKGLSASFYTVLFNEMFVKIDYIISKGNQIYALCSELVKKYNFVDYLFNGDESHCVLQSLCPTFIIEIGKRLFVHAEQCVSQLVVIELDDVLYATPVSDDFEVT